MRERQETTGQLNGGRQKEGVEGKEEKQ